MNLDKKINNYIEREKQVQVNNNLAAQIMLRIESAKTRKIGAWEYASVAASIAIVITLGIGLGSKYIPSSNGYIELSINDSKIENLNLYDINEDE